MTPTKLPLFPARMTAFAALFFVSSCGEKPDAPDVGESAPDSTRKEALTSVEPAVEPAVKPDAAPVKIPPAIATFGGGCFWCTEAIMERLDGVLDDSGKLSDPVVTEVREAGTFWLAEANHQDFYRNNPNFGYCRAVISPKMKKFGFE